MIDMGLVTIAGLPRSGAGGQETGKEVNRQHPLIGTKVVATVETKEGESPKVTKLEKWEGEKLARILPHSPKCHHFPVGAEVFVKVRSDAAWCYSATPTQETLRKSDGRNEYMPTFQYLLREHFELVEEVVDAVTRA